MQPGNLHEALKPITFLIGKWKSISANGSYPTIKSFEYCEELEFQSIGQPMLNYKSVTWHSTKGNPMHLESGFLRIKPGSNQLAFMIAHNFGLTSLEEGCVENNSICFKATKIARMPFAQNAAVTEIQRTYKYIAESQCLELLVEMATTNTPLMEHLKIVYQKAE